MTNTLHRPKGTAIAIRRAAPSHFTPAHTSGNSATQTHKRMAVTIMALACKAVGFLLFKPLASSLYAVPASALNKMAWSCHHIQRNFLAEVECSRKIFGNTKAPGATLMLKIILPQSTPAWVLPHIVRLLRFAHCYKACTLT